MNGYHFVFKIYILAKLNGTLKSKKSDKEIMERCRCEIKRDRNLFVKFRWGWCGGEQ